MPKCSLSIIIFLQLLSSCHRLCTPNEYDFNGGIANIYPDLDSIRIGDTLLFNSSIPISLKYQKGSSVDTAYYDLRGATNVGTNIHLTTPLGLNMQAGALDSFSFFLLKGAMQTNLLAPHASKTISYIIDGNNYAVSLGLVANKKGVYFLSILDLYQARKECDKISVSIKTNDADNHLHYLKDIYYGGGQINPIDSSHIYCFKVY